MILRGKTFRSFNCSSRVAKVALTLAVFLLSGTSALSAPVIKDKAGAPPSKDKKATMPIIYDFGASWCVPCKKFAPVFDKVAEKYKGKVDFQHIDAEAEKHKALVDKYKVMTLPTIVFVDKSGNTVVTKNKVLSEAELIQQTDALIK